MSHLHTAPHAETKASEVPGIDPSLQSLVTAAVGETAIAAESRSTTAVAELPGTHWTVDGEAELKKIPFFVRGKVKRNTEKFASDRGITAITIDTLYEAKAQIGQ